MFLAASSFTSRLVVFKALSIHYHSHKSYIAIMKLLTVTLLAAFNAVSAAPLQKRDTVQGFDISHYQGSIDFDGAYSDGARFVIIKVSSLYILLHPTPYLESPSIFITPPHLSPH